MTVIQIDAILARKLSVGVLLEEGVVVAPDRSRPLEDAIVEAEREISTVYKGKKPSEIEGLQPARALYKSIGVDPTRMRPSSEALARRILKGGKIPRINSAVDTANLVSLQLLMPVGLYDADRINGRIFLRLGQGDEGYERISGSRLNLYNRIGLFDETGGFGNPTGDSARTAVDEKTGRLLFVLFAPFDIIAESMNDMMETAARSFELYLLGKTLMKKSLGGCHNRDEAVSEGSGA